MEDFERHKHNLSQAICSLEFLITVETDPDTLLRYLSQLEKFRRQMDSLPDGGGA